MGLFENITGAYDNLKDLGKVAKDKIEGIGSHIYKETHEEGYSNKDKAFDTIKRLARHAEIKNQLDTVEKYGKAMLDIEEENEFIDKSEGAGIEDSIDIIYHRGHSEFPFGHLGIRVGDKNYNLDLGKESDKSYVNLEVLGDSTLHTNKIDSETEEEYLDPRYTGHLDTSIEARRIKLNRRDIQRIKDNIEKFKAEKHDYNFLRDNSSDFIKAALKGTSLELGGEGYLPSSPQDQLYEINKRTDNRYWNRIQDKKNTPGVKK